MKLYYNFLTAFLWWKRINNKCNELTQTAHNYKKVFICDRQINCPTISLNYMVITNHNTIFIRIHIIIVMHNILIFIHTFNRALKHILNNGLIIFIHTVLCDIDAVCRRFIDCIFGLCRLTHNTMRRNIYLCNYII